MNWVPLHTHDYFSLLDGYARPKKLAKLCKKYGYAACAVTNHGNVANAIQLSEAMNKESLQPILGNEFYLSTLDSNIRNQENRKLSHLPILAKGLDGWKTLIKATSLSNSKENFYYKPRLSLEKLGQLANGNLIALSGHPGSDLANVLFTNINVAYNAKSVSEVEMCLHTDWGTRAVALAGKYQELFGKDNFYIEICLSDRVNMPAMDVIANCLRAIARKMNILDNIVATSDSHYLQREDAEDQRVLIATALRTTLSNVVKKIDNDEEFGLSSFFKTDRYHLPSLQELLELHKGYEHEITNTLGVAEKCGVYKIFGKPQLPHFECPEGLSEKDYLHKLCEQGFQKKIVDSKRVDSEKFPIYRDRLNQELEVLLGVSLEGYFLIVKDIIDFAKKNEWLVGPGRGSAAGCLVSYLIDITSIDPIKYNLSFERFYNAGRNTKDKVSFPDIDSDFPVTKRGQIIEYIQNKYCVTNVGHIATFGRMQGREALKSVLRAHEACNFETMNKLTDPIPDEAKIADELQEITEQGKEASIIRWTLENYPKLLQEYCFISTDNPNMLEGPFANHFAQAIRLEGTYRNIGKHASGIIVSPQPLHDVCPMVYDTHSEEQMCAMEFEDLEKLGLIKLDILGVAILDKITGIRNLLKYNKIEV